MRAGAIDLGNAASVKKYTATELYDFGQDKARDIAVEIVGNVEAGNWSKVAEACRRMDGHVSGMQRIILPMRDKEIAIRDKTQLRMQRREQRTENRRERNAVRKSMEGKDSNPGEPGREGDGEAERGKRD